MKLYMKMIKIGADTPAMTVKKDLRFFSFFPVLSIKNILAGLA